LRRFHPFINLNQLAFHTRPGILHQTKDFLQIEAEKFLHQQTSQVERKEMNMSSFFNSNKFSIGATDSPSRANLLQFRGWAVAKEIRDYEGFGMVDLHFELHNSDPSKVLTITHAEWYHASHGGWLTLGPRPVFRRETNEWLLDDPNVADTDISYNGFGWGLARSSHLIFLFRVERPGFYQHLIGQLPIIYTPATQQSIFPQGLAPSLPWAAPDALALSAPVFLTLMEDLFYFPITEDGEFLLPLTGQIVNGTGDAIQIMKLQWQLESDDHPPVSGDIPLQFSTRQIDLEPHNQPSDAKVFAFNSAIRPPGNHLWTRLKIQCTYTWRGDSSLFVFYPSYSIERTVPVSFFTPEVRFIAPVGPVPERNLLWGCGNSIETESRFNLHNKIPNFRYAYDLELYDERSGLTYIGGSNTNSNDSYFAFKRPVLAMADGTVVAIMDTQADNQGGIAANPPVGNNLVIIRHARNFYAAYIHIRQHSVSQLGISPGQVVKQGQQIADLGNAGFSTAPHLHIMCWKFDERTGVVQAVPMQWENIEDEHGRQPGGVAVNGTRFRVM
jgi:hypothetical protein